MSSIIDRRPNQGQKNLGNRQRFLRRSTDQIKRSIKQNIQNRSITDTASGERVKIPVDNIKEPTFGHNHNSGINRRVLPGNRDFVPNDTIDRPKSGGGSKGRGNQASNEEQTSEDEFSFVLTKEEFYDILFEDLELPDLVKKQLKKSHAWEIRREGISTAGNPSNLNVIRTMKQSLGRRIVLRKPNERLIAELECLLQDCTDSEERLAIEERLDTLRGKVRAVSYVDPIDLRYNVFNRKQIPSTTAVMFCVMDVSGSMDEHKKDLAKRFFMLLYLFLQKKYEQVIIEFVRHHTSAERVDEKTFFYDKLTGGTMVSSALQLTHEIIQQDYNNNQYNIYVCQASDGDNFDHDNSVCRDLLINNLLPAVQYMAYIEIGDPRDLNEYPLLHYAHSRLYNTYDTVSHQNAKLHCTRAWHSSDIYSVFRELFEKK